ncbi:hypothetical protein SEVIR_7G061450v4 [Setaria viridis]
MTSPAAAAQHPRVLLRFTHNTLRIPEELAAEIGPSGSSGTARARSWAAGGASSPPRAESNPGGSRSSATAAAASSPSRPATRTAASGSSSLSLNHLQAQLKQPLAAGTLPISRSSSECFQKISWERWFADCGY